MFSTLRSLCDGGWTILLVEQNARSGLAVSDHGAVLESGTVKIVGTGAELLSDGRVAELYLGARPKPGAGVAAQPG